MLLTVLLYWFFYPKTQFYVLPFCSAARVAVAEPPEPIWTRLNPAPPGDRGLGQASFADGRPRTCIQSGAGVASSTGRVLGPLYCCRHPHCPPLASCRLITSLKIPTSFSQTSVNPLHLIPFWLTLLPHHHHLNRSLLDNFL